jgi:hypothetical protein
MRSVQQSGDDDTDDEDKGVYDSSNKKRVPSWCVGMEWLEFDVDVSRIGVIEYYGSLLSFLVLTLRNLWKYIDLALVWASSSSTHSVL